MSYGPQTDPPAVSHPTTDPTSDPDDDPTTEDRRVSELSLGRRRLLQITGAGAAGSVALSGAATAADEVPIRHSRSSSSTTGGTPPDDSYERIRIEKLNLTRSDGEPIAFGGDTGRSLRVRNVDTGASVTLEPTGDQDAVSADRLRPEPVRRPEASIVSDRLTAIGLADSEETAVEFDVDVTGDAGSLIDVFGTFEVELLDADGTVLGTTDERTVGAYQYNTDQDGPTLSITRQPEVDENWTAVFEVRDDDDDLETVRVPNADADETFDIDLTELDLPEGTYPGTLLLIDQEVDELWDSPFDRPARNLTVVQPGSRFDVEEWADAPGDLTVDVSEDSVTRDGDVSVTLSADAAEHLRVHGDTDGWTISEMDPLATLIGSPTVNDEFPYESGDEDWYYADSTHDELTIDLEASVDPGTYEFTAQQRDLDDAVVAEEQFTIEVTEADLSVEVSNETVGPDGMTRITVESENAEHLRVIGDTDGWTISDMDPLASVIGGPTLDEEFPYESGDESWYYAEETLDGLVIDLDVTVPEGTYQFTAQRLDVDDAVVVEEAFAIEVEEPDYSEWPVEEDKAGAIDRDQSGNVSLTEIRDGVQEWSGSRQIGGQDYTLSEIREIVQYWASS